MRTKYFHRWTVAAAAFALVLCAQAQEEKKVESRTNQGKGTPTFKNSDEAFDFYMERLSEFDAQKYDPGDIKSRTNQGKGTEADWTSRMYERRKADAYWRERDREFREMKQRDTPEWHSHAVAHRTYWMDSDGFWHTAEPHVHLMGVQVAPRPGVDPKTNQGKGMAKPWNELDTKWRGSDRRWRESDFYWSDTGLRDDPRAQDYWTASRDYWRASDDYWRTSDDYVMKGREQIESRTNQGKGTEKAQEKRNPLNN